MKEFHATRVPTVLIGIGGIGGQIVRLVDKDLRNYDKQFVQMVVLDTNTNDLRKSISLNIPFVQTSENMTVSDYLRQNSSFREWFPMNPLINTKNLTQGAGQIRSVSRLGALASEDAHRFDTIRHAIENVSRNVGDSLHNMVRVMIVGSVCGGTGSGMGIQLPFLVRDLIEEISHLPRTIIRGLFIMPDIVESVQDTDEKKRSVNVNGYAFLRELNAFNRAQTFQRGTEKLNIEHYHREENTLSDDPTQMSGQVPYDFLFLVERSNNNGQNIGGFDAYISKSAQIVKAQLFASDMTSGLLSSEDNLIVSAVNRQGLNRFCGAGISKAVYPEEENIRYCSLRFSESILSGYWLRIDRMVKERMAQHKRQMATNPSLMPKDPQEEFIAVFDEQTDPTKTDVTAEMGQLKRELVHEAVITDPNGKERAETVNYAAELFASIDESIENLFESDEVTDARNACKMSTRKLNSNSAVTYCNDQLQKLRLFEKSAKERVGKLTAGAIDSILGADYQISQIYNDSEKYPYNIGAVISDKHPIVARYILYYIRRKLKDRITAGEAEIVDIKERQTIFEKDYYKEKTKDGEKDTVVEDPSAALVRTKPGMLSAFGIKSAEYTRLVQTIVRDANAYIQRICDLSKLSLMKEVYSTVIKRLDILIDIYENFFSELEQILFQNRADREILEAAQPRIQNSDVYVCADTNCKKWLYEEFEKQLSGADASLSDDIKEAFYNVIFKEYTNKYAAAVDNTAFTRKPLSMKELFESAMLQPLINKYKDKEMSHVKMDIIAAINLEYNIHCQKDCLRVNGSPVNSADFSFEQYFGSITGQLKALSEPYLTYSTLSEEVNNMLVPNADVSDVAPDANDASSVVSHPVNGRVISYWSINNSAVAKHQKKENSEDVDRDMLQNLLGQPEDFAVNDDSFDEKELVCYSSVYDLCIENLDKYKKGSKSQKEYTSRLLRVIKSDYNVGTGASAYLDTVHPHLNRRWHAHSYLPMLRIDEEMEEQKRIARAFLLGIACNRIWYMVIDRTPCWTFQQSKQRLPRPLSIDGEAAYRSSFYTLFKAFDENTVVVNDILRSAEATEREAYNSVRLSGITEKDILNHFIIKGFIGDEYSESELSDLVKIYRDIYSPEEGSPAKKPINILKVIYSIYQDSYDLKLVTGLIDYLIDYLNDYCRRMTNNQKGLARDLFRSIAKAIGDNFDVSGVEMQFIMLCDTFLN